MPLSLVEQFEGGLFLFGPVRELLPGARYRLRFHRRPKEGNFGEVEWTVGREADSEPPTWSAPPAIDEVHSMSETNGRWSAILNLPVDESASPLWADVRAVNESSGASGSIVSGGAQRRLLEVSREGLQTLLYLPGSWYGGRLELQQGKLYTVEVELVDAAGNRSRAERIRLKIPLPPPPPEFLVHTTIPVDTVRHREEPEYRELARKARIAGPVDGSLKVDAAGRVVSVEIAKGLPMGLTEATIEALSKWKFVPAQAEMRTLGFRTHFLILPSEYSPSWSAD